MENTQQLSEIVDPQKSALVMWDVQKMLVDRVFNKDEFISNANKLVTAGRARGVPVFFTKITLLPERFESPSRKFFMKNRARGFAFTPEGFSLAIEPGESDTVILKNTASIFVGTNFELVMRNAGLTAIVFSGISTEMVIESSARDALNRGFFPVVITDAVSSPNKEAHERSLQNLANMMILMTTAELTSLWLTKK